MASMTVTDRMMQRAEELVEWAAAETPLAAQATVTAADVLRYCAWMYLAVLEESRDEARFALAEVSDDDPE